MSSKVTVPSYIVNSYKSEFLVFYIFTIIDGCQFLCLTFLISVQCYFIASLIQNFLTTNNIESFSMINCSLYILFSKVSVHIAFPYLNCAVCFFIDEFQSLLYDLETFFFFNQIYVSQIFSPIGDWSFNTLNSFFHRTEAFNKV